jgi:hypothetical protein
MQLRIKRFWNKAQAEKPALFNGDVLLMCPQA